MFEHELLRGLPLFQTRILYNHEREFTIIREAFQKEGCHDYVFDGYVLPNSKTRELVDEAKFVQKLCMMSDGEFNVVCKLRAIPPPVQFFRKWWIAKKDHPSLSPYTWVKEIVEHVQLEWGCGETIPLSDSNNERDIFLHGYCPTFHVKNRAWIGEFRDVDDILQDVDLMRRVRVAVHLLANRVKQFTTRAFLVDRNLYYFYYMQSVDRVKVLRGKLDNLHDMSFCFMKTWDLIVCRDIVIQHFDEFAKEWRDFCSIVQPNRKLRVASFHQVGKPKIKPCDENISQKSKLLKERTRRILSDVTNVQNVHDFANKPHTQIDKPAK